MPSVKGRKALRLVAVKRSASKFSTPLPWSGSFPLLPLLSLILEEEGGSNRRAMSGDGKATLF